MTHSADGTGVGADHGSGEGGGSAGGGEPQASSGNARPDPAGSDSGSFIDGTADVSRTIDDPGSGTTSGPVTTGALRSDAPSAAGSADHGRPSNGEILSGTHQHWGYNDVETIGLQTVASDHWSGSGSLGTSSPRMEKSGLDVGSPGAASGSGQPPFIPFPNSGAPSAPFIPFPNSGEPSAPFIPFPNTVQPVDGTQSSSGESSTQYRALSTVDRVATQKPSLGPLSGFGASQAEPFPSGPTRAALATDLVTCPECGQMATVDMARRQAEDFCSKCDFPLFWARGTVITPSGQETGASLRRLPGTVGRAATAALLCPHCAEPNSPAAEICVRCALSLHPIDIPEPEPLPVIELEPEPEPEPEPEERFSWWWVVLIVFSILVVVGMIVWAWQQ